MDTTQELTSLAGLSKEQLGFLNQPLTVIAAEEAHNVFSQRQLATISAINDVLVTVTHDEQHKTVSVAMTIGFSFGNQFPSDFLVQHHRNNERNTFSPADR